MKLSTRIRTAVAIATTAGLLAATGCAGDTAESEPGVLNVGQISNSVAFFPLYVAEQEGYFTEEGVELGERPRLGTGAKLAAALTSGSIDVGAGVLTDAFNLAESNPETQVTGSLVTDYYVDIVTSSEFDGPAADASLEDKVRALEGKNIGITGPGSGTEALVIYLFEQVGLDAKTDATLVNLGAVPSSAIGALSEGQVDALAFFQPTGQMAETQGVGDIYISPQRGDIPDLSGSLHGALFSTSGVIEEKGEEVEAFNRAIDRALEFIQSDPEASAELLATYLEGTDPEAVEALNEILPQEFASSSQVSRDAFDTAVDFHLESQLIDEAPEYDSLVWSQVQE
ncbi:ABC transporter substrate-binding protein [Nocardiopsis aegyptia]|uniref:ABC-type nitrate/sulfonate/bicarbonate transport system substrate-binding protein n=1 Tax=Nocardiopsis aegyptia TaxID=220378 RepID=A0A7Z0J864_9ACTN|nr:ABC transporter substrate-binding protein [Nocardiopsis aegyptia]NYJ32626.1 ABC-type nitrate/sulfonate/bicarbonate transport system substrate-binding protein [Nocardiopsis aegyptia]